MKSIDIIERIKELDSRYLEWDFFRSKWLKSGNAYLWRLQNRAWASYQRLVINRNAKK